MTLCDAATSNELPFDDLTPGRRFDLGVLRLSADEITAFARTFDPQPQHVDAEAAQATVLGGLCASGWQTCAALNRMLADAILSRMPDGAVRRFDDVRWKTPIFAAQDYAVTAEVTAADDGAAVVVVTASTPQGEAAAILTARIERALRAAS